MRHRTERAAATCPEGWALNEKKVNWRTGAFSCTAKPEVQQVCPDGLAYYECDGMIGCRQDRRDRKQSVAIAYWLRGLSR